MKIYMTNYLGTSGGAGRFMNTLKGHLLKNGFEVTHKINDSNINLALINANSDPYSKVIELKYLHPNLPIVHRLDGLCSREKRTEGDLSLSYINDLTDFTIFQSKHCYEVFQGVVDPKNYEVIFNGSEYKKTITINNYKGDLKIYHSSWATGLWKKIDRVFEFIEFCKGNPKIQFYTIGNYLSLDYLIKNKIDYTKPKDKRFLEDNRKIFEKYPNVNYQGYMYPKESMELISSMDYLFFPSIIDSCPNTVVESLCCEVPVIYHNSGGTPELVGDAGIDIDSCNYQELIEKMLTSKDSLKEKTKGRIKELNMPLVKDKYVNLFNKALCLKTPLLKTKEDLRLGWIMCYGEEGGSSRIGGFNIHNKIQNMGLYSEVIHYNKVFSVGVDSTIEEIIEKIKKSKINVLVLQKVCSEGVERIVDWCKENSVKVVFAIGDISENSIYDKVDLVVTSSIKFKEIIEEKYPSVKKVIYIEDGLETNPSKEKRHLHKKGLNIGWFGNKDKIKDTDFIRNILNPDDKIVTISNTEDADYTMGYGCSKPWDVSNLTEILIEKVDIIVIPIDTSIAKNTVKSANRLTLAMSLGFPVIASLIPSYTYVKNNNKNSFLEASYNDLPKWKEHIDLLRNHEERTKIGSLAKSISLGRFNQKTITQEYIINFLDLFRE
ncbi:glycosyltransferase [bacterium]|nr:glycosyltransferase [bacterium]